MPSLLGRKRIRDKQAKIADLKQVEMIKKVHGLNSEVDAARGKPTAWAAEAEEETAEEIEEIEAKEDGNRSRQGRVFLPLAAHPSQRRINECWS